MSWHKSEIINRLDFSLLRFLEAALHSPLPACSCSSKHNIYPCVETTPQNHLLKWFMYDRAISHLEKKPFIFVSQVVTLNFWLCPWPWYSVLLFMSLLTGSSHLELVASTVYLRLHHPSPWLSLSFLLLILMKCINDLLPESPGFSWYYRRLSSLLSGPSYWVFPWKTHPSHHPPYGTSVFQCLLCFSSSLPFCKKCPAKMASLGIVFFSCL